MGFVPIAVVYACHYKSLFTANKRLTHVKVKLSKHARSRKNVARENSGILEQEVSSGKSCPVQQRPQLLTRTTYRGIQNKNMTTNAKSAAYTTSQSAPADGEVEHKNPKSNADSPPPPQSEAIPVAPLEGDTPEASPNVLPASDAEPMTTEAPVIPESKGTTVTTDMWLTHAYIAENNFKYKSLSNWCLNTSIGCSHGCLFCYVPELLKKQATRLSEFGVDDLDAQWGQYVFVREWDEKKFLASLRRAENTAHEKLKKDGNRAVMLCTTTDPYQTIRHADPVRKKDLNDRHRHIVRRSLELIRDHSTLNVRILTRSPLAKIDFHVMKSLGDRLLFGMSLPTLDDQLIRIYEPSAPGATARLKTLKAAREAGLNVYVAVAPTYPECDEADIRATLQAVKELDPVTVFHEPINIRADNVARIQAHADTLGVKLKTEVFVTPETWLDYAVEQLQMAERIAVEVGLGERIHLWPDNEVFETKKALKHFSSLEHEKWLWKWWNRVSEWPGKGIVDQTQDHNLDTATDERTVADRPENPILKVQAAGKIVTGLTAKSPDQILEMKFDPNESYLFDGLFSKGQAMTLVGPGGIGKSRLLLQLAAAMIVGKEFLGIPMSPRKLRWLFIQNENSSRRLNADFQKLKAWIGDDGWPDVSDNIRIQTPENYEDTLLDLNSYKSKKLVEDYIRQNEPDVIVFDPLCAFTSGSLNSDSSMRNVCLSITQVARAGNNDRSVVVVHHALTGKEGARKAVGLDRASYGRGSKALHSWTRGQINVSPSSSTDNRKLLISCGKNSNGEEFRTFGILLNPDTLIYERDEDFSLEQLEASLNGGVNKPNPQNVARIVAVGPLSKKDLVAKVMEKFGCQKSVAYEAIGKAKGDTIELNEEKKFELKKSAA
jgi:DNA repair photolyase